MAYRGRFAPSPTGPRPGRRSGPPCPSAPAGRWRWVTWPAPRPPSTSTPRAAAPPVWTRQACRLRGSTRAPPLASDPHLDETKRSLCEQDRDRHREERLELSPRRQVHVPEIGRHAVAEGRAEHVGWTSVRNHCTGPGDGPPDRHLGPRLPGLRRRLLVERDDHVRADLGCARTASRASCARADSRSCRVASRLHGRRGC